MTERAVGLTTDFCRRCKRQMDSGYLVDSPDGKICGSGYEISCDRIVRERTPAWDKYLRDGAAKALRLSQSKAEALNQRDKA